MASVARTFPETLEWCSYVEDLARNIMKMRQSGKSRFAALAFVQKLEAAGEIASETANLAIAMIDDAFEEPVETGTAQKVRAIEGFRNRWGIICEALDCVKGPPK